MYKVLVDIGNFLVIVNITETNVTILACIYLEIYLWNFVFCCLYKIVRLREWNFFFYNYKEAMLLIGNEISLPLSDLEWMMGRTGRQLFQE